MRTKFTVVILAIVAFFMLEIDKPVISKETTNQEIIALSEETIEITEEPKVMTEDLFYILEENEYTSYWNEFLNNNVWMKASIETGIEAKLLMAISIHETGNFKSTIFRKYNNVGGNLNNKGKAYRFDSFEEGVMFMAYNLIENRAYRNIDWSKKTIDVIKAVQKIYAPIGVSNDPNNLNNHWVSGVTKYYNRLIENESIKNNIMTKQEKIREILYT